MKLPGTGHRIVLSTASACRSLQLMRGALGSGSSPSERGQGRLRVSTRVAAVRYGIPTFAIITLGPAYILGSSRATLTLLLLPILLAMVASSLIPVWVCPICQTKVTVQVARGSACPLCGEHFDGTPLAPEARVWQAMVARRLLRPDEGKEIRDLPAERIVLRQRALHDPAAAQELARVSQAELDLLQPRLAELEPRSRIEVDAALAAVDLRTRVGLLQADLAAARGSLHRLS